MKPQNTICLGFEKDAHEAARFYAVTAAQFGLRSQRPQVRIRRGLNLAAPGRVEVNSQIASPAEAPAESAASAGLRYVSDRTPGIRRKKSGTGFSYVAADGKTVRDPREVRRIRSLVIPPAWTDIWICANPSGHLQVTGRDARGRKQYRYHPRWREVRDEAKYDRLPSFAAALPQLRRRLARDLAETALSFNKVVAAIVQLLEKTLIRVGNEEYARSNRSFGLTTLETAHARITGSTVRFRFRGKSGKFHDITLSDSAGE